MSGSHPDAPPADLEVETAAALERTAVRIAQAAGDHIRASFEGTPEVDFKAPAPGRPANSNPVSRIDRQVECLIRREIAAEFAGHAIIGEELPDHLSESPFSWVIDPLDGTSNFVNGVPLFGCSVGVLYRSRPVAGAIWCSATHALRPGVYHAREGGELHFDWRPHIRRAPGAWRGLACEPGRAPTYGSLWDTRVLGCATMEFAFVAAGLLRLAFISHPAIWDAAAGVVLANAARCRVLALRSRGAETLLYFERPTDEPTATLAQWSEPLLIGDEPTLSRALAQARDR